MKTNARDVALAIELIVGLLKSLNHDRYAATEKPVANTVAPNANATCSAYTKKRGVLGLIWSNTAKKTVKPKQYHSPSFSFSLNNAKPKVGLLKPPGKHISVLALWGNLENKSKPTKTKV